jgi:hypothetical protein
MHSMATAAAVNGYRYSLAITTRRTFQVHNLAAQPRDDDNDTVVVVVVWKKEW